MDHISLPPPFQIYPEDLNSFSLPFERHQSGETRDLEISQQERLKDLLVKPCIIGSEIECLGDLVGKLYSDSSVIDSVELVSEALDHVMEGLKLNKIRLVICYKENIEELVEKLGSEWSPSATFPTEHPSIRLLRLPCAQNRENEIEILLLPKEEPHPLDTHRDPSILLDVWMACGEATEWKMDHAENDRSSDQLLELWRSGGARDAYQRYFLAEKLIDAWSREGGFLTHLRDEREQRKLTEFLITQCGDFPRVAFAHFDRKGWEKKEGAERLNWLLGLIPRIRSVESQEQIWNLVERLVKGDKNGILVILNAYKNHLNNPYLQTVVPKLQALLLQKGVSSPQCIDRVDEWLREIERDEASRTIWEPLFSNWIKTLVNGGCCDRACRWISETHTRLSEDEQRLAQLQRDPREYLKQTSYAQFLQDRKQFGVQAFSRLGEHILKGLSSQKMIECHPIIYSMLGIHWIEGRENPRAKFCTDYLFHLIPYLAIGRSKEWAVVLGKLLVQLDKWPAQGVVDRLQLHLFEVLEKGGAEDVLALLKKQSFIQLFKKDALFEAVFKGFKKRSVPLSLYCKAIDELREAEWQKNDYMKLFRRYSPILDKAGTEILLKKVPSLFGMMGGDSDINSALATIGKTSLAVKRHWIKPLIFPVISPENPANSDNCALSNSLGIYLEDEKIEKSERAIALLYLLSEMLQEKGGEFELPINRIGEALREIGQFNSHRERVESCLDRIFKCANDSNYSIDFEWSLLAVDSLLVPREINSSMVIDWMNLLMGNGVHSKKNYSEKVILALRLFERVCDRVDLNFKIKLSEWILEWIAGGNKKNCPSSQRLYHLGGSIALIWDETCEFSPEEDYTSLCEGVVSNAPYWAKPFLLDCIPNCVLTEWSVETQMDLMDLKEWKLGSSTRFLSLLNSIESKLGGRDDELHRHFEKNVIDVCQGLKAKDLVDFLNSKELSWLARMKVWNRLVKRGMSEKGALALICQLKKMHPKLLFEKSARIITSDNLVEDGLKAIPRRVKRQKKVEIFCPLDGAAMGKIINDLRKNQPSLLKNLQSFASMKTIFEGCRLVENMFDLNDCDSFLNKIFSSDTDPQIKIFLLDLLNYYFEIKRDSSITFTYQQANAFIAFLNSEIIVEPPEIFREIISSVILRTAEVDRWHLIVDLVRESDEKFSYLLKVDDWKKKTEDLRKVLGNKNALKDFSETLQGVFKVIELYRKSSKENVSQGVLEAYIDVINRCIASSEVLNEKDWRNVLDFLMGNHKLLPLLPLVSEQVLELIKLCKVKLGLTAPDFVKAEREIVSTFLVTLLTLYNCGISKFTLKISEEIENIVENILNKIESTRGSSTPNFVSNLATAQLWNFVRGAEKTDEGKKFIGRIHSGILENLNRMDENERQQNGLSPMVNILINKTEFHQTYAVWKEIFAPKNLKYSFSASFHSIYLYQGTLPEMATPERISDVFTLLHPNTSLELVVYILSNVCAWGSKKSTNAMYLTGHFLELFNILDQLSRIATLHPRSDVCGDLKSKGKEILNNLVRIIWKTLPNLEKYSPNEKAMITLSLLNAGNSLFSKILTHKEYLACVEPVKVQMPEIIKNLVETENSEAFTKVASLCALLYTGQSWSELKEMFDTCGCGKNFGELGILIARLRWIVSRGAHWRYPTSEEDELFEKELLSSSDLTLDDLESERALANLPPSS